MDDPIFSEEYKYKQGSLKMNFIPLTQTKCRRRSYLMRHAEACYTYPDGSPIENSASVGLTPKGEQQADNPEKN